MFLSKEKGLKLDSISKGLERIIPEDSSWTAGWLPGRRGGVRRGEGLEFLVARPARMLGGFVLAFPQAGALTPGSLQCSAIASAGQAEFVLPVLGEKPNRLGHVAQ